MSKRLKPEHHTGLHSERCQNNPREQAFAEEWREENRTDVAVNYGFGILQDLMMIRTGNKDRFNWVSGQEEVFAEIITERDARIVATVVQWLGSNIGMDFIRSALSKCGYDVIRKQGRKP